ncbi:MULTISPECIES: chemotaxis protein CheW [Sphingobium]|uniref:Chemotaxis protein CheW n=1 Tax=Sphingobium tyrosinilyticum TaxID=2715436 RepID=A0ABV9EZJ2_9SPHN|nr:chemotaxis protein CheW [Sphingobium sp. EP60837]ANI79988.1 hypothetical protein EP837_03604 [Sphingobium sp. EP60837]
MRAEQRLVFRAGERRYALPASRVREIARLPQLTPVPLAPPCLLGLGNVRGETLAVLCPRTSDKREAQDRPRRILILSGAQRIALAVDSVDRLSPDQAAADEVDDLAIDDLVARSFPVRETARRALVAATARNADLADQQDRIALLRFAIGDQSFALPVEEIAQVLRVPGSIARLPGADPAVIGTMAWEDITLGLLSLAALLGLPGSDVSGRAATNRASHIIVVALGSHRLGLLVDRVESILQLSSSRVDDLPATVLRNDGEARIRAICRPEGGGKLVSILAADHLLSEARTRRLLAGSARHQTSTPAKTDRDEDSISLLPVRIGEHLIAFPVAAIAQVATRPARLTKIAGVPPWLLGVAPVHGEPLAIIDQVLRMTGSPASGVRQRLLRVQAGGQRLGFLVDDARAIVVVKSSALAPAPLPDVLADGIFCDALQHGGKDGGPPMLVINPAALISSAEQELLAEVTAQQLMAAS